MVYTYPATAWVAGSPSLANFNARITDQFNALGEAWTSYTPTWTSSGTAPVLGNGTLTGKHRTIGKTIDYEISLLAGSTTTFGTGNYVFSLPVTSVANVAGWPMGIVSLVDGSASTRYPRIALFNNSTSVYMADMTPTLVAATVPFAFANTDRIIIRGQYEAA